MQPSGKLELMKAIIKSLQLHQLMMGSFLHLAGAMYYHDPVSILDC
jgi:hypothetical protein